MPSAWVVARVDDEWGTANASLGPHVEAAKVGVNPSSSSAGDRSSEVSRGRAGATASHRAGWSREDTGSRATRSSTARAEKILSDGKTSVCGEGARLSGDVETPAPAARLGRAARGALRGEAGLAFRGRFRRRRRRPWRTAAAHQQDHDAQSHSSHDHSISQRVPLEHGSR